MCSESGPQNVSSLEWTGILCGFQFYEESKSLQRNTGTEMTPSAGASVPRPVCRVTGGSGVCSAVVLKTGSKGKAMGEEVLCGNCKFGTCISQIFSVMHSSVTGSRCSLVWCDARPF